MQQQVAEKRFLNMISRYEMWFVHGMCTAMMKSLKLQRISILAAILLTAACATTSLDLRIPDDPAIQALRHVEVIKVSKWEKTDIKVQAGETVILTPLYPKGFIYPVKGRVGPETFEALDVDSGAIYEAKQDGHLHVGIDAKTEKIPTAVFIFKDKRVDTIISDLNILRGYQKNSKFINLTLGIINKNRSETIISKGYAPGAFESLDQAIHYFSAADRKTYATTLYRLFKMKASLYKLQSDRPEFEANINRALDALMRASTHYRLLQKGKYAFLNQLTQQERFALLTKTEFFKIAQQPYNPAFGTNFANLTTAYVMLARYYTDMGNLRLSLTYSEFAIAEARKSGNYNLMSWAYQRGLASRHYAFGFYDRAEQAYRIASMQCSASASGCQWGPKFALAVIQYQLGELDTAEKYLKKMELDLPPRTIRRSYIEYRLGLIYLKQGRLDQAVSQLQGAYKGFKRGKDYPYFLQPTKVIGAGLALCRCYIGMGSYEQALDLLDQIKHEMRDLDVLLPRDLDFKLTQARLFQKLNQDPAVPLMQAIGALEKIRPTANSNRDYEYWERMLNVYNDAVAVLFEKEDFTLALEVAEKARSRRFLDHIGNKRMGAKGKVGYLLSQQASDSLESLSLIEKDMLQAAKTAGIRIRNIYQKGTRYSNRLTACYSKFAEAAAKDQQYGYLYNIQPVRLEHIQKSLPEDVTIIEYYLSENALYSWVINRQNIFADKQLISQQQISTLIKRFRATLTAPAKTRGITRPEAASASIKKEQSQLYEILLAPFESYINTPKIGIVPYGVLNYLPFQALHDGQRYLIEKYAISYIPSLSILKFIHKQPENGALKILAFGNPQLGDPVLDLPATEKEVETIRSIFPAAKVFKRVDASEAKVKQLAGQYTHIHFASHGEYVPQTPLASCLRLAVGNGEDGRLEADEVFDLDLKADMVVTSACQTAIGKISKGDEIVGLTRAFIYAGAQSVLGSLWNISDEATAGFMYMFYANIQTLGKVEALRQAQLKMIASEKYQHPFYWAAFNMTGGL